MPPEIRPVFDRNFAINFKKLREDQGLTQEEVVERLKHFGFTMHQATIYKIEKGERKVSVGEAMALASILDTSVEVLTDYGIDTSPEYFDTTTWRLADAMFEILAKIWQLTDDYELHRTKLAGVLHQLYSMDDEGVARLDAIDPDERSLLRARLDRDYLPTVRHEAAEEIRALLRDATAGPLRDPFTNISGLAEFSEWEQKANGLSERLNALSTAEAKYRSQHG